MSLSELKPPEILNRLDQPDVPTDIRNLFSAILPEYYAQKAVIEKFGRLQTEILPAAPEINGWSFGIALHPSKHNFSGDYYSFILPKSKPRGYENTPLGFMIADIVGKGVETLPAWVMLHALTQSEAFRDASPAKILSLINLYLLEAHQQNAFIPCLHGVLYPQTGVFPYARAGHPPPISVDNQGNALITPIQPSQPLALTLAPYFDEQTLTIPPGGGLIFCSDGLFEMHDPAGNQWGKKGILKTIKTHWGQPIQVICDQVLQEAHNFGGPGQDDCLVIGFYRH